MPSKIKLTGPKRTLISIISLLIVIAVAGLILRTERNRHKPAGARNTILTEVPVSALPLSSSPQDIAGLKRAVKRTLHCMKDMSDSRTISWAGGTVTAGCLKDTLRAFLTILGQNLSVREFKERLSAKFRLYRVTRCGPESPASNRPVLFTGYFQPELPASTERNRDFTYPIYGVPDDLLKIDLKLFSQTLPPITLYGRVAGRQVLPYYTREEIDGGSITLPAPVLAWLASPVDGLMLHIQGSGLLKFANGDRRYIHFAASNGHPYGSLGRWLIKKGWLSPEDADWPGIRQWAYTHPQQFRQALGANPRYIFFRWEERGPVGSLGAVLVPMRSVALDTGLFPAGALCFIDVPQVHVTGKDTSGLRRFVLNQDRGNAIKGACRVDIYCGEGKKAGEMAGKLRHRGDMYILIKK